MQFIDPVLDLIPPLLVLPLREVEFPLRCAGRRLPLLVRRLRLFQSVEFLTQAVEVLRLLLKAGAFGLELRGDLPLIPDFGHTGLESLEAGRAVLQGRRRPDPALMLRLEVLRLLRMEFEVGLECAHAISADLAFFVQASQLLLQTGEPTERFLAGGDLRFFRLDVGLQGREPFLRPLESLFEDLQAEELLEHREALRSARGPELLHLLLPDEGRVPEAVIVEADHVPNRAFLVRDRPLDSFSVPCDLEVRFLLRRDAADDVPSLVPLVERHADVSVRPTYVGELHALDVRAGRLGVQGEGDRVEDRRLPRSRAARDDRVLLWKPEGWDRLLKVPHEPPHLDLFEDEPLRSRRGLEVRDRGRLDLRGVPQASASLSTRRASTLIASRFG